MKIEKNTWIFVFIFISILIFSIINWTSSDEIKLTPKERLEIKENKKECSNNICKDYEDFNYDEVERVCNCLINNEIVKSKQWG